MEVVGDLGEGAIRLACCFLQVEEAGVLGGVGLPLWAQLQVVVHALVADIEVFVAPVGGGERRRRDKSPDFCFFSAELGGLVHREDVVEDRTCRDRGEVPLKVGVASCHSRGELELTGGREAERPWEHWGRLHGASLADRGHF